MTSEPPSPQAASLPAPSASPANLASQPKPPLIRMRVLSTVLLALIHPAWSQTTPLRNIPARTLPTPTTVSPELQKEIAPAWNSTTNTAPITTQQWKAMIQKDNEPEANKV